MKKLLILMLIILLSFSCFACNDIDNNNETLSIQETPPIQTDDVCINGHKLTFEGLYVGETDVSQPAQYVCNICNEIVIKTITSEELNIPFLNFDGDLSAMSKDNEVKVAVKYVNDSQTLNCDATLKWQGASSLAYPKKNYTMKLLQKGTDKKFKVELSDGWGKQNKYCLKANYIDSSAARNVVSGKIFNQIVKTREINDEIELLSNGGVVDGFPILIFINGGYQGLYTLNIPKDKWMFGMDDDDPDDNETTKQALLMCDTWNNATKLKEKINSDYVSSGFDLEHCSTEDTIGDAWVIQSFNDMIDFVNSNDGEDFKNGINNYVNVENTIDSMLYTWFINAEDNLSKNILWVTYDGTHWFSSMYDMDATWGIFWDGSKREPNCQDFWEESENLNLLWKKIRLNFNQEITKRYYELRKSVLNKSNIEKQFSDFFNKIPDCILAAENKKWENLPSKDTSSYEYIISFSYTSLDILDRYFANNITQLI